MKKNYRNCHKILKFLYDEWNDNDQKEKIVGSIKISAKTKIPVTEIHELQYILINNGEIVVSDNDGQSMIAIQEKGITSVVEEKYLKDGRKEYWDGIFDWARIITPIIAIIISLIALYLNQNLNSKVKILEEKIEKLVGNSEKLKNK